MILKLNKKQLDWVLEDTRFSLPVREMFFDYYVNNISKSDCARKHGKSQPFAAKKFIKFDELLKAKCAKAGLKLTTIVHKIEDSSAVLEFDVVSITQKGR